MNLHADFHIGYINYFPSSSAQVFPFLHILLLLVLLMGAILTGMRRYLTVVLGCSSLMIGDAEHPFMCLLAICVSSWKNGFRVFCSYLSFRFVCFDVDLYENSNQIYPLQIASPIQ